MKSSYTSSEGKYLWLKVSRNRIDEATKSLKRINHKIKPDQSIMLGNSAQNMKKKYLLTNGIVHFGGADSGHYCYLTKQEKT